MWKRGTSAQSTPSSDIAGAPFVEYSWEEGRTAKWLWQETSAKVRHGSMPKVKAQAMRAKMACMPVEILNETRQNNWPLVERSGKREKQGERSRHRFSENKVVDRLRTSNSLRHHILWEYKPKQACAVKREFVWMPSSIADARTRCVFLSTN